MKQLLCSLLLLATLTGCQHTRTISGTYDVYVFDKQHGYERDTERVYRSREVELDYDELGIPVIIHFVDMQTNRMYDFKYTRVRLVKIQ